MMIDKRHKYDEEFMKNAVILSFESGKPVAEVASNLGIPRDMLYRWRKKYTPQGEKNSPDERDEEFRALKKQLRDVLEENDMLKKATAYFARQQR